MLNKKVAKRIKEIRVLKAITQSKLSKLVGISQAEISRIENSSTGITLNELDKIAKALGVTVSELLDETVC